MRRPLLLLLGWLFLLTTACAGFGKGRADGPAGPAPSGTSNLPPKPGSLPWKPVQGAQPAPTIPLTHGLLLPAHDAQGHPLFYYGRIWIVSRAQHEALTVLAFTHRQAPFFDEYAASQNASKNLPSRNVPGRWEYAIGTGTQWNVLLKYRGIVERLELNPREGSGPHPALDAFLQSPSAPALDSVLLAREGFMPRLPVRPAGLTSCPPPHTGVVKAASGRATCGWLGDIADAAAGLAGDVLEAGLDLLERAVQEGGAALGSVLQMAYDNVSEAIDFLQELGNSGYCLLAGKRSNTGDIRVIEPGRGMPIQELHSNKDALLAGARIYATAGPLGILLTEARIGDNGVYVLEDLCGDLEYTLEVELEGNVAFVTSTGLDAENVELGTVTQKDTESHWTIDDRDAVWYLGAQLGRSFARREFKFTPPQVKIVTGFFADDVIGGISNGVPVTLCGQASIATPVLGELIGLAFPAAGALAMALAEPFLNGDIYGHSSTFLPSSTKPDKRALGIVLHEYGHYTMCRAIAHYQGDLAGYLNRYMEKIILHGGSDKGRADGVRNTAESIADLFSYRALGYTDYFQNERTPGETSSNRCSRVPPDCLEDDQLYRAPDNKQDVTQWREMIANRTSVMNDWFDAPPNQFGEDDGLQLEAAVLAYALSEVGSEVTTQSLGLWLSQQAAYGKPAEALCTVWWNHGWDCKNVAVTGAQLTAPLNVNGQAVATDRISWSWSPSSLLATQYVLLNFQGGQPVEVETLGADKVITSQQIAGAKGNDRVLVAVEARRGGAIPGRSAQRQVCTLAQPVSTLTVSSEDGGPRVRWQADGRASGYKVMRAQGQGSFIEVETVSGPLSGLVEVVDSTVAPLVPLRYRVDALNCNGVPNPGSVQSGTFGASEADFIFVRAGAQGGDGSRAKPFGTLTQAATAMTPLRFHILASEGTYPEHVTIPSFLKSALVFGGYDATFSARSLDKTPTRVVGDGKEATVELDFGGGEFPEIFLVSPTFSGEENQHLVIDGVQVESSCSASPCKELTLAVGGTVELRNVRFTRRSSTSTKEPRGPSVYCRERCTVADSVVSNGDVSRATAVLSSGTADVQRSTIDGGMNGIALRFASGVVDASILRGDSDEWMAKGSVGLMATCARVMNSVVGGEVSVHLFNVSCDPLQDAIVNSAMYGNTEMARPWLINNILVSNEGPFLQPLKPELCFGVGCTNKPTGGALVRFNLFVPRQGNALIQPWFQKNLPPLTATSLNNPAAWFGKAGGNSVEGNLVEPDISKVFAHLDDSNNLTDPLAPAAMGVTIGAGTNPQLFGISLTHDLAGKPRPKDQVLSIGPY